MKTMAEVPPDDDEPYSKSIKENGMVNCLRLPLLHAELTDGLQT